MNGARAGSLYDEAIEFVSGYAPGGTRPGEHGKTDGQIIAERLAQYELDPELHGAVGAKLDELSVVASTSSHRREPTPGVNAALAAVAQEGWTSALLTGNSPTRARAKLSGAGIDTDAFDWEHSFFGDRARQRSEITAAARAALLDQPSVIIGDTPSDDLAAATAGIPFIAVATGIFSVDDLRETGAVVVLDDLVSGLSELRSTLRSLVE
ncbi:HAD family hydrolase [Naasia lichenicola]|uniref:HAD family hydrolase n=2 Tax=Naasia lichenicola TaxID=2565933 RepID=A0A4V3WSP0_9MICO|nr:HAD family hydrolase [Naasia lichenicola]